MEITRVYTGDDDQSHFETIDVPLIADRYGSLSELIPSTGVIFRETPVGGELDFHNAPRRQFVITLSGGPAAFCRDRPGAHHEVECGDGSKCQPQGARGRRHSVGRRRDGPGAHHPRARGFRGGACSSRCPTTSTWTDLRG